MDCTNFPLCGVTIERMIGTTEVADSRKRYTDKLNLVDSDDPYEVLRSKWLDNVD